MKPTRSANKTLTHSKRSAMIVSPRFSRPMTCSGRMLEQQPLELGGPGLDSTQILLLAVAPALLVDARIDPCPQQNRIERLRQIVLGPGLDAAQGALGLRQGRDHDDRNPPQPLIGLYLHQHIEPADIRHHEIEQDEVELFIVERLQRLIAPATETTRWPSRVNRRDRRSRLASISSTTRIEPVSTTVFGCPPAGLGRASNRRA